MKNRPFYLAGMVILLSVFFCCACMQTKQLSAPDEWKELFNGKDMNDWWVKINHHEVDDNFGKTFRVEDGMIKVRYDQYADFNNRFAHLYYKKPFDYFHLIVEYRFTGKFHHNAPGYAIRNSGVMFHSQDPRTMYKDQDWPISVEMQFLAGLDDGKARPTGNMCSPGTDVVFEGRVDPRHCIESSSKTYPMEEWVRAEAMVYGDSLVKHIINGDTVLVYSKPQIGGGVVNNYNPSIKIDGKLLSSGYIALQAEGQEIDFRRVSLKEIPRILNP